MLVIRWILKICIIASTLNLGNDGTMRSCRIFSMKTFQGNHPDSRNLPEAEEGHSYHRDRGPCWRQRPGQLEVIDSACQQLFERLAAWRAGANLLNRGPTNPVPKLLRPKPRTHAASRLMRQVKDMNPEPLTSVCATTSV